MGCGSPNERRLIADFGIKGFQLLASGSWQLVIGCWFLADLNIPQSEIRNHLYLSSVFFPPTPDTQYPIPIIHYLKHILIDTHIQLR